MSNVTQQQQNKTGMNKERENTNNIILLFHSVLKTVLADGEGH